MLAKPDFMPNRHYYNVLKTFAIVAPFVAILHSCASLPKADTAVLNQPALPPGPTTTEFVADTASSYVAFTGYGAGHHHTGRFRLLSGSLDSEHGGITGGTFVVSIRSMEMQEHTSAIVHKLRPHLLGSDFFDVEHFPESHFVITRIVPYKGKTSVTAANYLMSGNLSLKGTNRNISFPVYLSQTPDSLIGKANFMINRSWWGITYGNDRSLKNKFISETVNIQLYIRAFKRT